jgi:hypothetical protein
MRQLHSFSKISPTDRLRTRVDSAPLAAYFDIFILEITCDLTHEKASKQKSDIFIL